MSEKRFKEVYGSIWDSKTDELYFVDYKSDEKNMKRVMEKLNSFAEENEQLKNEKEELKNKIFFLKKRKKYNNKIGLGHYTIIQNKKKLLSDEWGKKNEIIKKEKGKEFYFEKLIFKYVGNYSVGEVNGSAEEIVWKEKE